MPASISYIYCLIDPRTDCVRYVGKANDVLKRYKSHMADARRRRTPVYDWINKLAGIGQSPLVASLAVCSGGSWRAREVELIAEYKSDSLLNLARGGDEPYCSLAVRANNGRSVAASLHSDPVRKRVWHLKREIGSLLKQGHIKEATRQKLRQAAIKCPELFGDWRNL